MVTLDALNVEQRAHSMSVQEPTSAVHIFSPPLTPAALAKRKPRHISLAMSLVLLVIFPAAVVASYMFAVAKDQFSSTMGFAVRTEDVSVSSDIFGSLAGLSSIGATDTDILYEFIQSAQLVRAIDIEVDLRGYYSEHYSSDPVFASDPSGTIEGKKAVRLYHFSMALCNAFLLFSMIQKDRGEKPWTHYTFWKS